MSAYHTPVLLTESIEALQIHPEGVYVDVTFGGGGHSREILKRLSTGTLLAFDQDDDAGHNAEQLKQAFQERSFTWVESNFRYLQKYLKFHGFSQVDGILADLGVSSHQFNEADRGFSTRLDGELDMRMDQAQNKSAKDVVNDYDEADLIHVLSAYGEVRNARTLAAEIIKERSQQAIVTTQQLRAITERLAPRGKTNQYQAQVFQAIRIEVNDEMAALGDFLEQTRDVIKTGGRLVVISYHSLEDRLVKNFMLHGDLKGRQTKDFYGNLIRPFEPVHRKLITPNEEELERNNRARSARMRIAKKI